MSDLKFTPLTPELYEYLVEVSSRESSILQQIREQNDKHPQIRMQIAPDQAQFLQFLIRAIGAKKVLELGTFLGYSAAAMAEALPEGGQVITLDNDVKTTIIAQKHWKEAHLDEKIQLRLGAALDTLQTLIDENHQFDFIFIDADKRNYPQYYQLAKLLLAPKGMMAIDNVLYHGEVSQSMPSKNAHAINTFNRMIHQDESVHISLLAIADGLTLVQKK